ncbi:MAG: hypothetical protein ACE5Z5_00475 [Candidatus Bathyarchaeia archaeon]
MRRSVRWDRISSFREEVVQLYHRFEDDMATLCERYGAKVGFWYSPSSIPQPRFVIDGVVLDADKLYDEEEFKFLALSFVTKKRSPLQSHRPRRRKR